MYARVDCPKLMAREDAVGKLSVAPAENRLPVWRFSQKTALRMALRLPNSVSVKPGPPGTGTRAPVAGSGARAKSLAEAVRV
jgi:hypothetical protein